MEGYSWCFIVRWGGSGRVMFSWFDDGIEFEFFLGFLGFFFYLNGIVLGVLMGVLMGEKFFFFFRNLVVEGVIKLIVWFKWVFLLKEF